MPDDEHSLVSVSSLCDDDRTVELKSKKCVMKEKSCVAGVGERAGGMYSVNLQQACDKALGTPDVTGDLLSVCHARLAHADRNAVNKMTQSGFVYGLQTVEARSTKICSSHLQGTMTKTPMRSQTTLEARPSAVLHTYIAEINVLSVCGAIFFVIFIDKASRYVKACHM